MPGLYFLYFFFPSLKPIPSPTSKQIKATTTVQKVAPVDAAAPGEDDDSTALPAESIDVEPRLMVTFISSSYLKGGELGIKFIVLY